MINAGIVKADLIAHVCHIVGVEADPGDQDQPEPPDLIADRPGAVFVRQGIP